MGDFDFLPGSIHRLGAPQSQQDDAGLWWVFSGFSNGMKQNETYVPDQAVGNEEYITANFVPGVQVTFLTSPTGLKLDVDGRVNWPGYGFIWGAGESHKVTAPAIQTDARGRKYQFTGWSNKGTAVQDIVVPNDRNGGLTMTATYQLLGQVRIITSPLGLGMNVDGVECLTPCIFDRESGAQMQIVAPKSIGDTSTSRRDFGNWSTGDATNKLLHFILAGGAIRARGPGDVQLLAPFRRRVLPRRRSGKCDGRGQRRLSLPPLGWGLDRIVFERPSHHDQPPRHHRQAGKSSLYRAGWSEERRGGDSRRNRCPGFDHRYLRRESLGSPGSAPGESSGANLGEYHRVG
jgi:hypothetical protein